MTVHYESCAVNYDGTAITITCGKFSWKLNIASNDAAPCQPNKIWFCFSAIFDGYFIYNFSISWVALLVMPNKRLELRVYGCYWQDSINTNFKSCLNFFFFCTLGEKDVGQYCCSLIKQHLQNYCRHSSSARFCLVTQLKVGGCSATLNRVGKIKLMSQSLSFVNSKCQTLDEMHLGIGTPYQ